MVNAIQEKVLEKLNVPQDRFKEIFLNAKTLRLTRNGRNRLARKYDSWQFNDHQLKSGDTLDLQRKMTFPYFIDAKMLVLFTERDAFMAKMAGAKGWIDGKS
jgi:hypothetical protein